MLKVDENAFTARIVNGSLDVSPLVGRLGSSRACGVQKLDSRHEKWRLPDGTQTTSVLR